jgi:hypothetical protein
MIRTSDVFDKTNAEAFRLEKSARNTCNSIVSPRARIVKWRYSRSPVPQIAQPGWVAFKGWESVKAAQNIKTFFLLDMMFHKLPAQHTEVQ